MDGMPEKMNKQPTPPVSVEKKHHQQQQTRPPFLHVHIDVQHVNLWTVFNAVVSVSLAFGDAYNILMITRPRQQASWQYTLVSALAITILWCSTPLVVLGALALLLPRHCWRLRRAAAYAALTITVAIHCMLVVVVVSMDARGLFSVIVVGSVAIFHFAAFDLLCFLVLLRGEWAH